MSGEILFVVALGWEERAVSRSGAIKRRKESGIARLSEVDAGGRKVHVLRTGVGAVRAAAAVRWAIAELRPAVVVSTGCAGALVPGLGGGELVIATEIITADGVCRPASSAWRERYRHAAERAGLPVREGRLFTSEQILLGPRDKGIAAERAGAVAVEMEAAATIDCARAAGIEVGAARVILDRVDLPIPAEVSSIATPTGRTSPQRLFAALARRPALAFGLLRLGAAVPRCRRALSRLHRELFRDLATL